MPTFGWHPLASFGILDGLAAGALAAFFGARVGRLRSFDKPARF